VRPVLTPGHLQVPAPPIYGKMLGLTVLSLLTMSRRPQTSGASCPRSGCARPTPSAGSSRPRSKVRLFRNPRCLAEVQGARRAAHLGPISVGSPVSIGSPSWMPSLPCMSKVRARAVTRTSHREAPRVVRAQTREGALLVKCNASGVHPRASIRLPRC
jgi:hypothetical protein